MTAAQVILHGGRRADIRDGGFSSDLIFARKYGAAAFRFVVLGQDCEGSELPSLLVGMGSAVKGTC